MGKIKRRCTNKIEMSVYTTRMKSNQQLQSKQKKKINFFIIAVIFSLDGTDTYLSSFYHIFIFFTHYPRQSASCSLITKLCCGEVKHPLVHKICVSILH